MPLIIRMLAGLVVAAATSISSVVVAAPASAATLPLEYSLDGVVWSATAPAILPDGWRPVPGSTLTSALHVRSSRGTDARVALYLGETSSPSRALLTATTLSGRLATFELSAFDGCRPLDSAVLRPGESAVFTLTVDVSSALTEAQSTPLTIGLDASMSDVQVTPVGVGCPGAAQQAGGDDLPATGGSVAQPLAVAGAAAALIIVGGAARRRARRGSA